MIKNLMPATLEKGQLSSGHINAYIPFGKDKGIHVFISFSEWCMSINKRDTDLAWLDFADHSGNFEARMEQLEWAEAVQWKYGRPGVPAGRCTESCSH
jgi:hypothetical protein